MADVFISYARHDQPLAEKIAQQLSGAGVTVWWDSELLPHNRFATVVEEEIGTAKAVLVIWSQAAVASEWVRAEAELARSEQKLIQIIVEDAHIPLPFNQIQAASLRQWHGEATDPQWAKVLASIAHFTGGGAAVAGSPAPAQTLATAPNMKAGGRGWLATGRLRWLALVALLALAAARRIHLEIRIRACPRTAYCNPAVSDDRWYPSATGHRR